MAENTEETAAEPVPHGHHHHHHHHSVIRRRAMTPARAKRVAAPSQYNIRIPLTNDRALAYNSMTGAFALWESEDLEVYSKIEAGEVKMGDDDAAAFATLGYAVPEGTDELTELEMRYNAYRNNPGGLIVTVAPTLACNFACDYCFQGQEKPSDMMSEEVQDSIVKFVDEESKFFHALSMTWYGGEPLLAMKAIRRMSAQLIEICEKKRRAYTGFIVTNGYRLTRKIAEELVSLKVTLAQVTFDGAEHDHDERRPLLSGRGTFQVMLDNLEDVVKNTSLTISIRVNIDVRNKDRVTGLLDQLAERGLGNRTNLGVYFAPVEGITDSCAGCSDDAMGKREYGLLETELTRYAIDKKLTGLPKPPTWMGVCVAARPRGVVVVPNGDVHKCWDTVMQPEMRIGVIDEPAKLESDPLHMRWKSWTPFANDICRQCKILPNCAGMCAYKFVHSDHTHGEAGALPCPSWKFNVAERLFLRAEKAGIVQPEDWDAELAGTSPEVVGLNHDLASVAQGAPSEDPVPVLPPNAIQC